jgi:hypothetical protein
MWSSPDQAAEILIEYFAPRSRATRSLQGCSDYVVREQQLNDNIRPLWCFAATVCCPPDQQF